MNDKQRKAMFAKGKPKRKMTQKELQNIQVEISPTQAKNLENLKKDYDKAKSKGDNRPIWEVRAEQVNYNDKQNELWSKMDNKTKSKILTGLGIESNDIDKMINTPFSKIPDNPKGYDKDFKKYLAPDINAHFKVPTEWFDKQ